jgi:hypothetical protein
MGTYKSKQYLFVLLKVIVVIAAMLFIYFRLKNQDTILWSDFKAQLLGSPLFTFPNMVLVIGLSVLNWIFEGLKWQVLVRKIQISTFSESFKQVLMAQTTSIFTPFKMGEYGAKTVFFSKKQAKKVVFLNFLGNMAQMCATMVFGLTGLFFFVKWNFPGWLKLYFPIVGLVLLLLFFRKRWIPFKRLVIKGFSLNKIIDFIKSIPGTDRLKILGFSFARYVFFSVQFCLLLSFLTPVSLLEVLPLVFTMYLLSSLLPVLQLFDFAVKGGIAVLVFSAIPPQIVVSVAFLMWLLNAVLPALAGSWLVLSFDTKGLLKPIKE